MSLKEKYFENRNISLGKSESILTARSNLAQREILTFEKLNKISGINANIRNSSFLDLGAGDQFLKHALDDYESTYLPLDIDDLNFNIDQFPLEDGEIDILFSLAVIEHISDVGHFMSECFRVLRPGGVIYLSTPNFRYCYRSFYNDPTHVRPFTDVSLEQTVNLFGFENVSVYPGARCKPDWFYKGRYKFAKCAYLPFTGSAKWVPSLFKGRATSIFCIGRKPVLG